MQVEVSGGKGKPSIIVRQDDGLEKVATTSSFLSRPDIRHDIQ